MHAGGPHILEAFPTKSGLYLGLLPLPLHLFLPAAQSYQLAAITLVLIAGIYLGFAFRDGRGPVIVIESLGALCFALAAWLGLNGYPQAIIAALALHGLWDFLHLKLINTDLPRWYIPFCCAADWVMAAGLLLIWTLAP